MLSQVFVVLLTDFQRTEKKIKYWKEKNAEKVTDIEFKIYETVGCFSMS